MLLSKYFALFRDFDHLTNALHWHPRGNFGCYNLNDSKGARYCDVNGDAAADVDDDYEDVFVVVVAVVDDELTQVQ